MNEKTNMHTSPNLNLWGSLAILMSTTIVSVLSASGKQKEQWRRDVLYNSTVNLTCEDGSYKPRQSPDAHYQWVLPSGDILHDTAMSKWEDNRLSLHDNGSRLLIQGVEREHFGIYYCIVTIGFSTNIHAVVRKGINVDGPYFGDLWKQYQTNLRTGLLAAGAVFVFMSMLCFNYESFQTRHSKKPLLASSRDTDVPLGPYLTRASQKMAYANPGFDIDGIEEVKEDEKYKEIIVSRRADGEFPEDRTSF